METKSHFNSDYVSRLDQIAIRIISNYAYESIQEKTGLSESEVGEIRTFNEELEQLFESIGTPRELSKKYLPSSQLLKTLEKGIENSIDLSSTVF